MPSNPFCCQKRWVLAILAGLGYMISFGIRCNLGAAKVLHLAHVDFEENHTELVYNEQLFTTKNASGINDYNVTLVGPKSVELSPIQMWDVHIISMVVSSVFYGSLILQIPGGLMAAKYSAKALFGMSVGVMSFFNLLMPIACMYHYSLVVAIQFIQGLMFGLTYPTLYHMWKFWAPPMEKTMLVTTSTSGSYAGVVIGIPVSAMLVRYVNWQMPFYIYGFVGIFWFFLWMTLTADRPSVHPTITKREKEFIESSIGNLWNNSIINISEVPWRQILSSKPVWAIIVANFCRNWTLYFYVIYQLSYMKEVLHMRIEDGGMWASLPHLTMTFTVIIGGRLADFVMSKKYLSRTMTRKLFNSIGFGGEAIFLFICALVIDKYICIPALVLSAGFSGFSLSGYSVNHLDIAPKYAGILMGLTNGLANISGFVCPALIEYLTKAYGTLGWRISFSICSCIHLTGVLIFALWGSAKIQSWALMDDSPKKLNNTPEKIQKF